MMNKSLEVLKKIVAGAPDCTEFFGVNYDDEFVPLYQCKESGEYLWWTGFEWGSTILDRGDTHIPIDFFRRIIKLEEEKMELMCTFEREIKKLAKNYVSMSNDVFSGVYSNKTPEGSIVNEQNFVNASYEDILDPIFISHKRAVSEMVNRSKRELEEENQRLRDQIKEMSGLCLNKLLTGRKVPEDYVNKLEDES